MAKKSSEPSQLTGYYFPCPLGSPALGVHPQPIAIPVLRGPKSFWVKCEGCGFRAYLGRYWKASFGLNEREARSKGYILLTLLTKSE